MKMWKFTDRWMNRQMTGDQKSLLKLSAQNHCSSSLSMENGAIDYHWNLDIYSSMAGNCCQFSDAQGKGMLTTYQLMAVEENFMLPSSWGRTALSLTILQCCPLLQSNIMSVLLLMFKTLMKISARSKDFFNLHQISFLLKYSCTRQIRCRNPSVSHLAFYNISRLLQ